AVKMTKSAFKTNLAKSAPWVQALIKGLVTRLYKMDELVKKHGLVDEKAQQSIENIEKKFKKDGAA
ncbi:MAG: hypothetical protein KDD25_09845, partial [Bdellovibrionales bacterium]|nr:hypothetical protein [Bdellovibrionales bacterium]